MSLISITIGLAKRIGRNGVCVAIWLVLAHFNAAAAEALPSIGNKQLSLQFYPPEKGGGIAQIKDASGFQFINLHAEASPLWEMTLKRIPQGPPATDTVPLSLDPEQNDGKAGQDDTVSGEEIKISPAAVAPAVRQEEGRLIFEWKGLDLREEKAALDVWVSFSANANDQFVRVRAGFTNRSAKYTTFYFVAPRLAGLSPADKHFGDDFLASPVDFGRLIRNPVANGLLGKPVRFQPNRSGHSMQFDAYYQGGHGLYLGVFDGGLNIIRYSMTASPAKGLSWAPAHLPNNMKSVPQKWETPYDTVLTTFSGDWFDACRIYREWALKQDWAREGPLITRASTPDWFKNIDEWMLLPVSKASEFYGDELKDLNQFKMGLFVTSWGANGYFHKGTPDRFPLRALDREFIEKANKAGIPMMGYIQDICWDIESPSFAKEDGWKHSVRNFYGQKMIWDFSANKTQPSKDIIVEPGDVWTNTLGSSIEEMARLGFKAAYLDSGNHGGTYLNFNPEYSADSGGGSFYTEGHRKQLRSMKERVRRIQPDFCFTAESFWEGNMAELDAYLVCNTTNNFLDEKNVTAIPMVSAVYHDYSIFYSAWANQWDLEQANATGYLTKFGQAFVWGIKAGWNQPAYLVKFKNHELALSSSLKRYEAYSASKKFLLYGKMLREPKLVTESPDIKFNWYISWRENFYKIATHPVLVSAWEAPDGTLGLVLYNVSTSEQTVSVDLSSPEYGLANMKSGCNSLYAKSASKLIFHEGEGERKFTVTLAPASPAVWEFKRQYPH